jgi:hypothetical protein
MVGENWRVRFDDDSETDIHIIKETDSYVECLQFKDGYAVCGSPTRFGKSSTEFIKRISE